LQDPSGEAAAAAQKHLTYYELDLGLNHVVRKWSDPVDNGANLLIAVPGGGDGPGGVLVCAENFLIYRCGTTYCSTRPELREVVHWFLTHVASMPTAFKAGTDRGVMMSRGVAAEASPG
jgi:hypothetical protein